MPTSADVAKLAGVSRATVSNVLNGSRFVSPVLADQVRKAIGQLSYKPHAVARSLAARKTHTIGVLVPMISSTFYPAVISAAERVFAQKGYSLVVCDGYDNEAKEEKNLQLVEEQRADGLIWAPCSERNIQLVRNMASAGMGVVVVDRKLHSIEFDTVSSDNISAGRLAADYLLRMGYESVAILVFSQTHASGRDRLMGFRTRLLEAGQRLADQFIFVVEPPEFSNARALLAPLMRHQKRPDAIFACSDVLTLACLQESRTAGLRIPEDVALLGFDDSPWNPFTNPPLTVITQDKVNQGRIAAQLLLKKIENKHETRPELVEIPVQLKERSSCGEATNNNPVLDNLDAVSDSIEPLGASSLLAR